MLRHRIDAEWPRTAAVGAASLGLVGLVTCWWFPFGAVVGACGLVLGVVSGLSGGGRLAWIGSSYGASGVSASLLMSLDVWSSWPGV